MSCFIYQTLHILAFSSHLGPSGIGTAPIVLVPCLFHPSYWSTEFFSVHFPFAFSDLWLKRWKKFTFVKLLVYPLTHLWNTHQLCVVSCTRSSQPIFLYEWLKDSWSPLLTEQLFIVDGSWRRKESLFWEEGAVAASGWSMLQWITLPSYTHRHYSLDKVGQKMMAWGFGVDMLLESLWGAAKGKGGGYDQNKLYMHKNFQRTSKTLI